MRIAEVHFESIEVNGLQVFYRHSVPKMADAPTIVLLHGFPSGSHQYQRLIDAIGDKYRVIAPDYVGSGFSDVPTPSTLEGSFEYTFDNLAGVVEAFLHRLGVTRFFAYICDWGSPVGFRIFSKHPDWVQGLIVQNGDAHMGGLGPDMLEMMRWIEQGGMEYKFREMITPDGTRSNYYDGASDSSLIASEGAIIDQYFLDKPVRQQIMIDLLSDYNSNIPLYLEWQKYLRQHQPPMLLPWGKNDGWFPEASARLFKRDVPDAELHLFD